MAKAIISAYKSVSPKIFSSLGSNDATSSINGDGELDYQQVAPQSSYGSSTSNDDDRVSTSSRYNDSPSATSPSPYEKDIRAADEKQHHNADGTCSAATTDGTIRYHTYKQQHKVG